MKQLAGFVCLFVCLLGWNSVFGARWADDNILRSIINGAWSAMIIDLFFHPSTFGEEVCSNHLKQIYDVWMVFFEMFLIKDQHHAVSVSVSFSGWLSCLYVRFAECFVTILCCVVCWMVYSWRFTYLYIYVFMYFLCMPMKYVYLFFAYRTYVFSNLHMVCQYIWFPIH